MTMKEKFTQGDWSINVCESIFGIQDFPLTEVVVGDYSVSGEVCNEHDAHLIAAAPKMYRLLNALKDFNCPFDYMDADEMIAFCAIEKLLTEARGESKDTD